MQTLNEKLECSNLSQRQKQAIALTAKGVDWAELPNRVDITAETLNAWLFDPEFKDFYDSVMNELVWAATVRFRMAAVQQMDRAIALLQEVISTPTVDRTVRVQAVDLMCKLMTHEIGGDAATTRLQELIDDSVDGCVID